MNRDIFTHAMHVFSTSYAQRTKYPNSLSNYVIGSSGELTTERNGRPRSPIPATDLTHDYDEDAS